ncbi:hypothetical protein SETIT_2G268200v2 [Setaria italica]|uniref:Uncharacterized protein n=1 Tax=Setaria italica TaxID=4555 RepID=A0A368Q3Z9_SETIT|nr:hypothetical protein SETIT_2G268200v2 [Setaria italica]
MVPAKDPEPMDTMRRSLTPAASGNSCDGADVADVEVQVVAVDDVGAGEEEGRRRGEVVSGHQQRRHDVPEQDVPEHPPQRGPLPSSEQERRPPAPRASSGASAALLPPVLPPYAHLFLFDVWAPPPPPITLSQCDSRLVTRPAPSSSVAACVAQRQAAPLPRQQVMAVAFLISRLPRHVQAATILLHSMCFGVSVSISHIGATYSIWQV